MNIPLYARMNEFAPAAAAKGAEEDVRGGQEEETHEEPGVHGTLFEQCMPERGKLYATPIESAALSAQGDAVHHASLTADVPDLKIGSTLAEGNLTDGYKLHDVSLFDSGSSGKSPMAGGVTEVAATGFEQSVFEKSSIVPRIELDYSSDASSTVTAHHEAAEPSGGRQAAA